MTQAQQKIVSQSNTNETQTAVRIKKLEHGKTMDLPAYATKQSAGMDLMAAIDEAVVIEPGERMIIPTGIAIGLPDGFEAQIRPRSGLAAKYGLTVLNTPGTIDADYRGEIKVILVNLSQEAYTVEKHARIAQMVIARYEHVHLTHVDSLEDTERGTGGFGSTGV